MIILSLLLASVPQEKDIAVYTSFSSFEEDYIKNISEDTTYIINFWATWCRPCVAELPYFEKLQEEHKDEKFKVVLVSLDFESKVESAVKPFVKKKGLKSEVVVLADGMADEWIDKIDSTWSGAIPATLVLKNNRKLFYEKSYSTYEDLNKDILK